MSDQARVKAIESWFARHDDGEFSRAGGREFRFVPPLAEGLRLIYTTKPEAVAAMLQHARHGGFMARYGLPSPAEGIALRKLLKGFKISFLGDLDAPDLLTFAWLRATFGPRRIRYLGFSDRVWACVPAEQQNRITLNTAPSETAAKRLVERALPDLKALLGPQSHALFQAGRKCELEGLHSFADPVRLRRRLLVRP